MDEFLLEPEFQQYMDFINDVSMAGQAILTPQKVDDHFEELGHALNQLKVYPDILVDLMTPAISRFSLYFYQRLILRSFARFNETNVQPAECYQNRIGEYIDSYIYAIKEAGNIWGIPVIDFNAVTGINPMIKEQTSYMFNEEYDLLHPSTKGQIRMARTLMYQFLLLPKMVRSRSRTLR